MVVPYKDWVEKLPFALWGYITSIRVLIRAIPYSMVYGSEAHWDGDIISESANGNQGPKGRLDETKIWATGFDRLEKS